MSKSLSLTHTHILVCIPKYSLLLIPTEVYSSYYFQTKSSIRSMRSFYFPDPCHLHTTEWSPKSSMTMLKWLFLSIYPLSQQHVHSYLFVLFRLCTWPGIIFSPCLPWRIRCIFPSHTNSNFCEPFYHVTDIDDRHNQASSSLSLPYDSMKIWSLW